MVAFDVNRHSFADWVRLKGGIAPSAVTRDAGEIRHVASRKEAGYNLLNSRRGRSLDELTSDAIDEGWPVQGSTHDDFLALLDRDIRAKKSGDNLRRVWHPSRPLDDLLDRLYAAYYQEVQA
jgi:hypothetical protein